MKKVISMLVLLIFTVAIVIATVMLLGVDLKDCKNVIKPPSEEEVIKVEAVDISRDYIIW